MAGFHIHLAVAKRYAEKNNWQDTKELYRGTIDPDLVTDKSVSHYSGKQDKAKLIDYLENKVNVYEYLKNHEIKTEYEVGIFLHLITDYLFFTDFMDKNYLKYITYDDFCKDLYASYDATNEELLKVYSIELGEFKEVLEKNIKKSKKEKKTEASVGNIIFTISDLKAFIERVSDIDLETYQDKIRKAKKNILP